MHFNEKKFFINDQLINNVNKINQQGYELPYSSKEEKLKLDLDEEENNKIIRNVMEDDLIRKIDQKYFNNQKGSKEYADKLKKFEEEILVEEDKFEKFKKKLFMYFYFIFFD